MNKKIVFESPLWGSISALLSGIVTNLVLPLLSTVNYECINDGKTYFVNQRPDSVLVTLGKILLTLFVFGLFWLMFALLPCAVKKRFHFWKKKPYGNRDIRKLIDENIKKLLTISENRQSTDRYISEKVFWQMNLKDLATIVYTLHCALISENARSQSRMKDYFREGYESILGDQTSMYQLTGLIEGIELMLREAENAATEGDTDSLLSNDCRVISEKINQIRAIIK